MTVPAADPADDSRPSASTRRGSTVWADKTQHERPPCGG
jgi:hypothetical protein